MTTGRYAKGDPRRDAIRGPEDATTVHYVSNRVRVGLHARNDYDFTPLDYQIIRTAKIETLKTMSHTRVDVYQKLRQNFPDLEFIVRLYDDRIAGGHQHPAPADFAAKMVPIIKSLQPYATKFEIHNEPNHQDLIEGWGPGLDDARDFNKWFQDVYRKLKAECPWAQLGFPGLALHHGGWRGDLPWLQACQESVALADWLGAHCYWQKDNMLSFDWGLYFTRYHQLFPDKQIEITEFGDSTPGLDRNVMAQEYAQYYDAIQPFSVYLRSASAFLATSPDSGWDHFAWGKVADNRAYPVVEAVGSVPRTEVVSEEPIDRLAAEGLVDRRGRLPLRATSAGDPTWPYDKHDVRKLTYIVIHHSTGAGKDWPAERLAQWDVTQTQTNKDPYPEMTYHFVVEVDGAIKRCHSLDVNSWHAGCKGDSSPADISINNWRGVGICLPGNFMAGALPTEAQMQSTAKLCRAILEVMGKKPADAPQIVKGHREVGAKGCTACPGDAFVLPPIYKNRLLELIAGAPPQPAYAYTLAHQTPAQVDCSATLTVPVTLKNTGGRTWLAAGDKPVHLSYHWADPAGKVLIFEGERTALPADVPPGGEVALQATVKTPPEPGDYLLQWDPVEEQVAWFSQKEAPVVAVAVTARVVVGGLVVTASVAPAEAAKAADGRPDTAWATPGSQAAGTWFQVDLGSLQMVRGFRAASPADQFPRGYIVSVSADGQNWQEVARQADNRGDVDVTFAPRKARYVRIEVILPVWAISEVAVQAEPPRTWKAAASHNPADAGKAIDGDQTTAWSSGAGQTPGMWFQLDLGGPQRILRIVADSPKKAQTPRGYKVSLSLDGQAWQEVAAKAPNYMPVDIGFGATRPLPLDRYVRIETTVEDQYKNTWAINELAIESTPAWTARASHASDAAGKALDGNPTTAWSSGAPQAPGMWYELDLGRTLQATKVVLEGPEKEFPRGLAVKVSPDGATWQEVGRVERFFKAPVTVSCDPVAARYIRIEQISDAVQAGNWKIPWTINEVQIFGTIGDRARATYSRGGSHATPTKQRQTLGRTRQGHR